MKPFKVIRGDWLLEPGDARIGSKDSCQRERFLAAVRAIGIDKQFCIWSNRLTRMGNALRILVWTAPNLHFHARNALRDPIAQLLLELLSRVRRKSPAAIDGSTLAGCS